MLTSSCSLAAFSAPAPCSLFFPSCPSAIMPSGACSPFSLRPLSCAARCPEPSESPAVPGLPRSTPSSPPSSPCTRASFPWWHWPAASHKSCSRRSSSAVRAWTPCLPSRWSAGCTIAPKVSTSASARTTTTTTTRSLIATITWTPTSKTTLFFMSAKTPWWRWMAWRLRRLAGSSTTSPPQRPTRPPPLPGSPPLAPPPSLPSARSPCPRPSLAGSAPSPTPIPWRSTPRPAAQGCLEASGTWPPGVSLLGCCSPCSRSPTRWTSRAAPHAWLPQPASGTCMPSRTLDQRRSRFEVKRVCGRSRRPSARAVGWRGLLRGGRLGVDGGKGGGKGDSSGRGRGSCRAGR
mmetsp:Transcript_20424/g.41774  ORF Transcript_20424/g.41774 Transcript_20424/m.41774 type:complete len:348 (+) Transcript_20424:221-1264(+)